MACSERRPRLWLRHFSKQEVFLPTASLATDQSEPVLKVGSTGLPVRRAQKRMSLVGYDVGGVDGRYGAATKGAVKKLQQQRGLAVDGVVGPQTWSIIDSLENEGPVS
jgi:peptidoglycan hydrolase-like protein with peptidoglycan-binding domain